MSNDARYKRCPREGGINVSRASGVTVPRAGRNEAERLAKEDDLVSRESRAAKRDLADKHSQLGVQRV